MKIKFEDYDLTEFIVKDEVVNGMVSKLIFPKNIGVKWTQKNKIFRSSLWDIDGNLISASLPKFPNFGESPDTFPVPTNLKNSVITNKLDGSLLIVSKINGHFILRTRQTTDATKLDNGYELEIFKERYLQKLDDLCNNVDTWDRSFLFEWLTASSDHTIVLKYDDVPDWILIGSIEHLDYSLVQQDVLNAVGKLVGFKRPEHFNFNTIDELVCAVTYWKDKEGVVLYTNDGQTLHKIKSDDYKKRHAFKSSATLENTLELYFTFGRPDFNDFQQKIGELYDWECAQMVIGHVANICDASKDVKKIVDGMTFFVDNKLRVLPTRKDQAQLILSSYSASNRGNMVFTLLDNKPLNDDQMKKLFWQCLKK